MSFGQFHRFSSNAQRFLRLLSISDRHLFACLLVAFVLFPNVVAAADYSFSGFGTLGYTRSDTPFHYQRFIDDDGTLKRDSVSGVQIDGKLTSGIGFTVQAVAAPSTEREAGYEGKVAWAFVSWRPSNDWLVRLGRQRIPLYLFSQTYNVGVTYDFARLPTEMYSISPSNDFVGVSGSKTWETSTGDMVLDGYWGKSDLDVRFWLRDGLPPLQPPTAIFRRLGIEGGGLVLTHRNSDSTYRIGISQVFISAKGASNTIPVTYPFVSAYAGGGYYQVDTNMIGPGIPTIDRYKYRTLTLGADVAMGSGYRFISEVARSIVPDTHFSNQSMRGYVSLQKKLDKWTPYLTYAVLHSSSGQLKFYKKVNANKVPLSISGAAQINASQRAGADAMLVYDQHSLAIGTSYALSPTSKIKAELMRVRIGQVSSFVDAPPGTNLRNQNINVISLSYSMVF